MSPSSPSHAESFTIERVTMGGLHGEYRGQHAFLPISEFDPVRRSLLKGVERTEIPNQLVGYIGNTFLVSLLRIDERSRAVIVSERKAVQESSPVPSLGDIVEGQVTGVTDVGIFVSFGGREGLVHRSEIAWGHVQDPGEYAKRGDHVQVKVIGLNDGKIALSMKQRVPDPWEKIAERYALGTLARGVVKDFKPYGAFIELPEGVSALLHISEISSYPMAHPSEILQLGEEVEVRIACIDPIKRQLTFAWGSQVGECGVESNPHTEAPSSIESRRDIVGEREESVPQVLDDRVVVSLKGDHSGYLVQNRRVVGVGIAVLLTLFSFTVHTVLARGG